MKSQILITSLFDISILDWGLDLSQLPKECIVMVHKDLKDNLPQSKLDCQLIFVDLFEEEHIYSVLLQIKLLYVKGILQPNDFICYSNLETLAKDFSFYFSYQNTLANLLIKDELFNHNLTEFIRNQGLLFSLKISNLDSILSQYSDVLKCLDLGNQIPELDPPLDIKDRDFEDINLYAAKSIKEPVFHIVGDSHSMLTLTPMKEIGRRSNIFLETSAYLNSADSIKYQFTHHVGSKTMFGFIRDENITAEYLAELTIKPMDSVLFVFGEIDIRAHFFKHTTPENLEDYADNLAKEYVLKIKTITHNLNLNIALMGCIPPMDGPNYNSEEYPIQGSLEERVMATKMLNSRLQDNAKKEGFKYFDLNDIYELEDGSLDMDKSDLFCHISPHHQEKALKRMSELLN